MGSPFQDINKIAQTAVSSAKEFIDDTDGEFDQSDLDEWLISSFEEYDYSEIFRSLYDGVLTLCVDTWIEIVPEANR